jgi:glycosyltransferase involved in cell wall biosynthesis
MATDTSPVTQRGLAPASASAGRISVALCTYNGARFLQPQLDSILAQTRLPDELVVCDDSSTDDTLAILLAFRQRAPFPVRVVCNETRLGSTKNFEKAIGICTGDIIATCDQDDVWLPEKLALGQAAFDVDARRGLVFSDAEVVDENLQSVGYGMWDAIEFGPVARMRMRHGRDFEILLRQWVVTGATSMFRSRYRQVVLPIPEHWIHDAWIALTVAALAPVAFIEQPTVQYRQHAAQQIGGKKLSLSELYQVARETGPSYFRLGHERFLSLGERLHRFSGAVRNPDYLVMLDQKIEHQRRRLAISENPSRWARMASATGELVQGRYQRYSPNLKHFVKDLLF